MIRQSGFEDYSKKTFFSSFDRVLGRNIFRILLVASLGAIVFVAVLGILNSSKLKKIFPQRDPYHLTSYSQKRAELYKKLETEEKTQNLYAELVDLAFLAGEIPEAEYFLGKCNPKDNLTLNLRTKINSYKNSRSKLEKYLFENGNYFDSDLTFPQAYELIDKILELCPTGAIHVRHLFLKGYLLLKEGRRSEARIVFDNLRKNGGDLAPTSLYLYAKTFMLDEDKSYGIEPFKEFISKYESSRLAPLAAVNLAKIFNSRNNPKEAIEILDSFIAKNPDSEYVPELILEKEQSLILMQSNESFKIITEALEKYPKSKPIFERANAIYDDWTNKKIDLKEQKLFLNVALVLIKNGRFYQSKKLLYALIPTLKGSDRAYGRYLLALRNHNAGERDSALKECNNAIQGGADKNLKSIIYKLMGDICSAKKDVSSAEKYYLKAIEIKGSSSDLALREIARTAYDNGWRAKAGQYYEKLINLFPNSTYVSEALNYLIVMAFYNQDNKATEKYSSLLIEKGIDYEDRLRGEYFLRRNGKSTSDYFRSHPLAYYSFIVDKGDVDMYLAPEKSYPSVNKYKLNLGWEYFLAGCYDLAEKEYQFINDETDPFAKMVLCYTAYYHKQFTDGIILTRDFMDGNYQASIEKGYMQQFYKKAFPIKYVEIIEKYAPQKGFPTSLILAIIRQESFFNPKVRSSSNALGLMQILPSTGRWIAQTNEQEKKYSSSKLTDPEYNIENGVWYLAHLRDVVGDNPGMILASHNGGPGNVGKWKGIFPVFDSDPALFYELIPARQTRNFVRYVLVNQRIYEKLYQMESENVYF